MDISGNIATTLRQLMTSDSPWQSASSNGLKVKFTVTVINVLEQDISSPNASSRKILDIEYLYKYKGKTQAFSIMNLNKSKSRMSLSDSALETVLRISTAKSIVPNIGKLIAVKRCKKST
ncbi:hypothetical protein C0J52_26034 [Blattella germanica]|nr:hypothetical protein C0J52_26034 [Blattella germanica]